MDLVKADKIVRNLKPRDKAYMAAVGGGLSCFVASGSGAKTLYVQVKVDGKPRRFKLGTYPACTIAKAFERAQFIRAEVKEGRAPNTLDGYREASGPTITVDELADLFIKRHVRTENVRTSWADEVERYLKVEVRPKIGKRRLSELTRKDIADIINDKADALRAAGRKGTAANRLAAVIGKMFSFAKDGGHLAANSELVQTHAKPVKEKPSERVLSDEELGALWLALCEVEQRGGVIHPVYARLIKLVMLSGARATEFIGPKDEGVPGLAPADVDLKSKTYDVRNGKNASSNRTIAMPPVMAGIVADAVAQVKAGSKSPKQAQETMLFQLPNGGKIPENEWSRAIRKLVAHLGHKPLTGRDLRRSATTIMSELGVVEEIRHRITGHTSKTIHRRVYDKAERLTEVRDGSSGCRTSS